MERPRRRLLWSEDADRDLLRIWDYGANRWSPTKADDHLRTIAIACDRLPRAPELGRARNAVSPGLRAIFVDPHVAFYRVTASAIEIVRVIHQHEDIEVIFH
jgi:toxin ParE1/3/4